MPRRSLPSAEGAPVRRALLVVAAVLALTADDRHAGKVSDGRQMIETAVAVVETGGLGLAKGAPRAVEREHDAVSRYGFGMPLAQLPAAFLAPRVERALGAGASQPLFLLAPFAGVLLATAAAGATARLAGATGSGAAFAVLLAGLGSPLGAYAASDWSEPLQAAALGGALALALAAAREGGGRPGTGAAALAGAAAGAAVLVKSSLAAVAPLALLPLLAPAPSRGRRLGASLLGAAPPLALWLALEVQRFGAPFAGYSGEGFTHPLADGAWRLLVGPNRGLLVFFPAAILALAALGRAVGRGSEAPVRLAAAGSLLASAVLLVTAAAWWAWHGAGGWGPRLLVPAVPLLAPWAARAAEGLSARARGLALALSVALNAPPLLLHPALFDGYVANLRRPVLTERLARELPALAVEADEEGRPTAPPDQVLATVPAAAPHVAWPWYFGATLAGEPAAVAERLARPPWYEGRPDLGPRLVPFPPRLAAILAPPPRWGFLGRSLRGGDDPARGSAYLSALAGQVVRAQESGRLDRALALSERLLALRPGEEADALQAETLRLLGRPDTARAFLAALPPERVSAPAVLAVRALLARDRADGTAAARLGEAAAAWYPETPLARAPGEPASWPATFAALTRREEPRIVPGLPLPGR